MDRILYIDDSKVFIELFKELFKDKYDIDTCESQSEAIEKLKIKKYDKIYFDWDPIKGSVGSVLLNWLYKYRPNQEIGIVTTSNNQKNPKHLPIFDKLKLNKSLPI